MTPAAPPPFIWNATLSEAEVRTILAGERGSLEQVQMMAHILQHARFDDIWRYVRVADVVEHWPLLRRMLWPAESRELWAWALQTWGYDVSAS